MRRAAWALLSALSAAAVGVGLLLSFPTRESCRASGRALEPTGRHCVAPDGYVQLREHVLFHTVEVVVLLAILLALGAIGYWVVRRRARRAPPERLLVLAAAAGLLACARAAVTAQPYAPAALRIHEFRSATFGNERSLRVLVPPGYDDPANAGRRYPVLYLNDGQNLFDSATGVFNRAEWRVDETVTALVRSEQIEPLIVVGVDNAGREGRAREYLPFPDEFLEPPEPDPLGRRYPEFLIDEVLPFVAARYRTQAGPEGTGLGGSSYGALAALYAASVRPGVFGRLLLESPSLYVDGAAVIDLAARVPNWPGRVYLGVGTHEMGGAERCRSATPGDGGEAVADVRRLAAVLAGRGLAPARLRLVVEACGAHDERAWARRLPEALRFLYGLPPRPAP